MQYVNRTYRRSGTLWEGRFRSCLTQEEAYVLACYRYIELNPVNTAGRVTKPTRTGSNRPWSSRTRPMFGSAGVATNARRAIANYFGPSWIPG